MLQPPDTTAQPLTAIIIGTGFGGLGMAIALRKQGITDFVILEKGNDVGGVWRDNSYPGAACDVPSHLYSFSFEPNPNWSRKFSPQAEIFAYLKHCAEKYQLLPQIAFGTEVSAADYDEDQALWRVTTKDQKQLTARLLLCATGQLSRPALPVIPGSDTFAGPAFHSAQWRHDLDLSGKRVAVIGSGASAIQFVPAIAGKVAHLDVFQRSAPYILPRVNTAYSNLTKQIFTALPWLLRMYRCGIYLVYESRFLAFSRFKILMRLVGGLPFQRMLKRDIADAALRAKMVPDYPIGCKRLLLSSEYIATFARPQVSLVTERIERIAPEGILTSDGVLHRSDVIIYGTGFTATEFLAPMQIRGRQGKELNATWADGARAYLGMTVPDFPNFFILYGPNTNLGHNSIVFMLESQIAHVMRCMNRMRATHASTIEVKRAPYLHFNAGVEQRLKSTVWHGCKSWYVDARGHNSTNWPGFTAMYRWITKRGKLHEYQFTQSD